MRTRTPSIRRSFHEQQDENRRKLRQLLIVFFSLVAAAGWLAGSGFERMRDPTGGELFFEEGSRPLHRDYRYLMTATALLLGFAHTRRLRRCGDLVILGFAGARPLRERRLENVAAEMAIAAALPAPRLWILEDDSLNAFAIGWDERSASIAITRGLLESLDRNELQAVIAHEIAHVRNGDTKLMTLLVGMSRAVYLLGSFALGPLGAAWSLASEDRASEPEAERDPEPSAAEEPPSSIPAGKAVLLVLSTPLLALALLAASVVISLMLVVAFAALFLAMPLVALLWALSELLRDPADRRPELVPGFDGRWALLLAPCGLILGPAILLVGVAAPLSLLVLRLAVSRNREHDADAGAVELTRNPAGLLGALRKLQSAGGGAGLPASLAPMAIAPPSGGSLGLFSTHPPLEERIRRVEWMA